MALGFTLLAAPTAADAAITGPAGVRAGYTATFTSVPASADGHYIWEFPVGEPIKAFTQQVDWIPPATEGGKPKDYVIRLWADGTVFTHTITVYSHLAIIGKDSLNQIVLSGEPCAYQNGETGVDVSGGDPSSYSWTVTGPLDVDPDADYDYMGEPRINNDFVFWGPTVGEFAGQYTVTIADGWPEDDYVNFWVPTSLEAPVHSFREGDPPITFTLRGAPQGAQYSAVMYDASTKGATQLTDPAIYGTITPDPLPPADSNGIITFQYNPPADTTNPQPFWIALEPQNVELLWEDVYNIYEPVRFGPMFPRNLGVFSGRLTDADGVTPVAGAVVHLVAPEQYSAGGINYLQNATANADGDFTFALPTEGKYLFSVAAPGYLEYTLPSTTLGALASDHVIPLTPAAAGAYVSGTVSAQGAPLTSGNTACVALVRDNAGVPEFVAELRITGNTFRIDLPENLAAGDYSVIAYRRGLYDRFDLPAGTAIPPAVTGIALDMNPIGDLPPSLSPPLSAGYAMNVMHPTKGLATVVELPAGCIDVDALKQPPTPPVYEVSASLKDDARSDPFVAASDYVLQFQIKDTAPGVEWASNEAYLNDRGMYITFPFDVTYIYSGYFFNGEKKIRRSSRDYTHLMSCDAPVVPYGQIVAIDFLGDGNTGWVTAWVPGSFWFGVGDRCPTPGENDQPFAWPDFERYEFYGCFIQAITPPEEDHAAQ